MLDTNFYKKELEEKLTKITQELETIGIHDPNTDDWQAKPDQENVTEADQNIEADEAESLEERKATLTAFEIEYQKIKRALGKIENGNYGICEICGKQIEEERLKIRPEARTCIEHMDEEEKLSW